MGVTAEKKNPSNITPSSIYLCISFCEVIIIPKSNNIYIFDKKKSRFLFLTNMYFKLTSLSTKIAYILRQRTNSKRFLQNSPITFLSSVVWKKKVNENQIEKKKKISNLIPHCKMPICLWILHESSLGDMLCHVCSKTFWEDKNKKKD